ncbi:MAG TPA: zinc-binding dehydrogenase [Acidimicrobiales bacterium]|nr:zinc-binding dehydrogenase [Acidimicrobiales bacterium]
MRAATIEGGAVVVLDHPDPVAGTGEVLVRVEAAGVNAADLHQRDGHYPAPPGSPPDIPGLELAGVVVATGPGAVRYSVGDRVMAVVGGGAQAELCTVHERLAVPAPAGVAWAELGGFPEAFTTAHDALFTQCRLAMGERVLVSGGAGGVGSAGVQLAVAAGASVTASVRDASLRDTVARLGAAVVDPGGVAGTGPYDVVLELVGAPNLGLDLAEVAAGGRIAVIGLGGGSRAELDLRALMTKRAVLRGSTLRARPLEGKAAAARAVESQVLPLLASGRVRVPVAATFPLAEVEAAYARFAAGGKFGKVVLVNPAG